MDCFRKEDERAIAIVLAHRGAIFGGYIRDCLAGDTPNDIDIVVPETDADDMLARLSDIYPNRLYEDDSYHLTGDGLTPLEIITTDDDPSDTIIGPCPDPDVDVNCLVYSKEHGLCDWVWGGVPAEAVLANIKAKRCRRFDTCSEERLKKIIAKGYSLMDETLAA